MLGRLRLFRRGSTHAEEVGLGEIGRSVVMAASVVGAHGGNGR
jgi:hypothetical protein